MYKKFSIIITALFIMGVGSGISYAANPILEWDAASGQVDGYLIYYGMSTDNLDSNLDVGNVLSYSLENLPLTEGDLYYFIIKAYNAAGEGPPSSTLSYKVPTTNDTTPPLAPDTLLAQVQQNTIVLSWTDSQTDISEYRVYYGTGKRDYGLPIPVTEKSYIINDLAYNTPYYMAITAVDSTGNESGYSFPEATITLDEKAKSTITLYWDQAAGIVEGYKIYYGTSIDQYTTSIDVGNVLQYFLNTLPLEDATTYYFVIRAYNASGEGAPSSVVEYTTPKGPDTIPPSIQIISPTSNALFNTEVSTLVVNGTASDNESIQEISWTNSTGSGGLATGTTSWSIGELTLSKGSNVITVTAKDTSGNISSASVTVTYTIPVDQTLPTISISSPSQSPFDTTEATISLSGFAHDNETLKSITWISSNGIGGSAIGLDSWSIANIGLEEGTNTITVTASDIIGNKTSASITINYSVQQILPTMEFGEITIDHNFKRVVFTKSFIDPVVIVKSLSFNGGQPAVVRVNNVDKNSFDVRIQEWEYLDGTHILETAAYLVIEKGSYLLTDGSRIEAANFTTNKAKSFATIPFEQPFQTAPVVLTSINSFNELDTVSNRVRNVKTTGFEFRMQEQELKYRANDPHATEQIAYIAWEPSSGTINGLTFEVGKTGDTIDSSIHNITFKSTFKTAPVFLGDMQSTDGGDSCNIRWQNKTSKSIEVFVDEEQSQDAEEYHTTETIGYILFSP